MGCNASNAVKPAVNSNTPEPTVKPLRVEITQLSFKQQQEQPQVSEPRRPQPIREEEDVDEMLEKKMVATMSKKGMSQHDSGCSIDKLFGPEAESKGLHSLVATDDDAFDGVFIGSAHSNISSGSEDSGIALDRTCASENGFVCEYSDPDLKEEVDKEFKEPDETVLEGLIIMGSACSSRIRTRQMMDENSILVSLAQQGLLHSEAVLAKRGGVAFELKDENDEPPTQVRPPRRLQSLKKRKKKKLTPEDIQEKLENAERNRERQMEEVRHKAAQEKEKAEQVSRAALDSRSEEQRRIEEAVLKRAEAADEKRERRLRERKERLRQRNEKAEAIRNQVLAERKGEEVLAIDWDETGGEADGGGGGDYLDEEEDPIYSNKDPSRPSTQPQQPQHQRRQLLVDTS